jgi:hypothetical protein
VSELVDVLRTEGGTLASVLVDHPGALGGERAGPAQLAARGPRVAGRGSEYELLLEMIFEGSLLHYGTPRVIATEDRDLALLLGDQLYAMGLARLSELGDLDAVTELADVISLISQAYATGDDGLADAIWRAGAVAIGWGSSNGHEDAKRLAREVRPGASAALVAAAKARVRDGRSDVDDRLLEPFNSGAV